MCMRGGERTRTPPPRSPTHHSKGQFRVPTAPFAFVHLYTSGSGKGCHRGAGREANGQDRTVGKGNGSVLPCGGPLRWIWRGGLWDRGRRTRPAPHAPSAAAPRRRASVFSSMGGVVGGNATPSRRTLVCGSGVPCTPPRQTGVFMVVYATKTTNGETYDGGGRHDTNTAAISYAAAMCGGISKVEGEAKCPVLETRALASSALSALEASGAVEGVEKKGPHPSSRFPLLPFPMEDGVLLLLFFVVVFFSRYLSLSSPSAAMVQWTDARGKKLPSLARHHHHLRLSSSSSPVARHPMERVLLLLASASVGTGGRSFSPGHRTHPHGPPVRTARAGMCSHPAISPSRCPAHTWAVLASLEA